MSRTYSYEHVNMQMLTQSRQTQYSVYFAEVYLDSVDFVSITYVIHLDSYTILVSLTDFGPSSSAEWRCMV